MDATPNPLVELSRATDPRQAVHPSARTALLRCAQVLQHTLPVGKWPKPFQLVALAFAELAGDRVIIADEMGLGKTVDALCRIILGRHETTIIVATASTLYNWRDEIAGNPETRAKGWLPGIPVRVLDREASPVPLPGWRGIVITTWDLLSAHYVALLRLNASLIVADEAHYATNPEALRTKVLGKLLDAIPHALLLTGTPMRNGSGENLWSLLNLLFPKDWPESTRGAFEDMDAEDIDEGQLTRLQRRIRQYMIRRCKEDVPDGLPPKHFREVSVELSTAARQEYTAADRQFQSWLERALSIRLAREASALGVPLDSPELVQQVTKKVNKAIKAEYLVKMGVLRKLAGLAKVSAAIDWIVGMVGRGEQVVVFAEYAEVLEGLAEGLKARRIPFATIIGATSKAARATAKNEFQAGKKKVFLASQAAKEGVTLTKAAHVLQVERWWTPAAEDQGWDRVHRISQKRQVTVWCMFAERTVDRRMREINDVKRKVTERVVGGTAIRMAPVG